MSKAVPIWLAIWLAIALLGGCRKNEVAIDSLADAEHAAIGVMTGSTGEAITKARFPQAQVKSFDDIMDAVAALKSGQLDAIVTAFPAALQVSKKNPEFKVLVEPLDHEDTAIAVKKGNEALLTALNGLIDQLKQDGTLASMKKRWFKPDLSPYEELNITLPTTGTPLKIGVSATREPFSFVDQNGRVSGHDGEFARIIGAKLQRPVEFYNMKFMALIPALQSGKVDLIVTGMTATDERRKFVDFTQPYYANAQVMLVRKDPTASPAEPAGTGEIHALLTSMADLADKRIGVILGSAHDTYASKRYPKATILQYKSPADVALAVKTGKVDAALYDADPLHELMRHDDSLGILGESLFDFDVGAGFNKHNQALRESFNRFLALIRQNGVYDDMVKRWMDQRDTRMPKIESRTDNGVLIVGTSDSGMPFTAVQDNRWVGFDIELAQRFAAYLGKACQFNSMDFGSLIAAVSSGKADMIASSIYITQERQKQIDFSEPYYRMGTLVFALKQNLASGEQSRPPITGLADIQDKRIGLLLGSAYEHYTNDHFPKAEILQYKTPSDLILAVRAGKIDAGVYNRANLLSILPQEGELALLGEPVLSLPVGMGFRQGNDALREQFNAFLKQIQANGVLQDAVERWVEQGGSNMPAIANPGNNGSLVVGIVSDKGLPFASMQENRLIGFDIELAQRFGAYLGKKVEFADMEFGNLIAAAAAGKIDMIDSTLVITPERQQRIAFSEPYYQLDASVFVLKQNMAAPSATDQAGKTARTAAPSFLSRFSNSFYSNIVYERRYLLLWDGLKTTVLISIFATLFGTLVGALICFMRMSSRTALNLTARIYINLLRGMPVLVLLMLIFYVVFASVDISPVLVAIIAFGLNFGAYVSEMFRTGIESISKGQTEAGIAMGFTKLQTFLFIVLPQAVQRILPVYKGEFISLVKMTSIVGYIAVQDLTKASDIIRARTFDAFFPLIVVAILYFLIAWVLMLSLEYLERVTDPKYKRQKGAGA